MSSSDFDILRELINAQSILALNQSNNHKNVVLRETSGDSNYSVVVRRMPHESIVIKTDTFPGLNPSTKISFFNGTRGERKKADVAIIARYKEHNWIVIKSHDAGVYT